MAIDKESTGVPEVDFGRRTTKVNLGIVVGVIVFIIIMFATVVHFSRREAAEKNFPASPGQRATESKSVPSVEPAKK
jgi:flagellar biosynthesis/type III secretory pathway M-ring protein FliF/YscJ